MKIRIRHRGTVYRLLRLSQAGDWSLVVSWDRKRRAENSIYTYDSTHGTPQAVDVPIEQMRLTYHSTGQVNYHGWVSRGPAYHEPLAALTEPRLIIAVSIPQADRLDAAPEEQHAQTAVVELADEVGDSRFTLGLLFAPLTFVSPPNTLVRVDYDLFSILCVSLPEPPMPSEVRDHFLHLAPSGPLTSRAMQPDAAMLAYHQKRVGNRGLWVYPPNGEGVYTLMTSVVMRRVPKVAIEFSDPRYRIEVINERARPMSIPFSIFRDNQRVTQGDLRGLITEITLDAQL